MSSTRITRVASVTLMAAALITMQGCAESDFWRRATDPAYAAQQDKIAAEKSENAYWAEQVVKGSPENLDTKSYKKLVVSVKVKSEGVQNREAGAAIVESAFASKLLGRGYTIAERSDLDRVVKEMGMQQQSGLTSTEDVVKAGKMLNAEAIMVVELVRYGLDVRRESYQNANGGYGGSYEVRTTWVGMTVKLIDIQKGAQVWTASYFKDHRTSDPQKALERSAGILADAFPAKQSDALPANQPAAAPAAPAPAAPGSPATAPATTPAK